MKHSNKPLPQHLNDFLDWSEVEKGLSNKTQENYHNFLKKFFDFLSLNNLDGILPHQLTTEHIWAYRLFLSRTKDKTTHKYLKKSTQNYYLIALRAFLNFFADRDITSLPAEKIKLARETGQKKSIHFLKLEQIEKLLLMVQAQDAIGLRDRAILETLFSTGLRVAELVSLNVEQFINLQNKNDLEVQIIGKGSRPRTVYFSERAIQHLKKYLASRRDHEKALFINYRARKNESRRLSARSVERIVKHYAKIAGLPILTSPHTLRHSYATDLLEQGVDLRLIQEFLGHSNIATTQIYTHVTSKKLRDIHRQYHSGRRLKNE